MSNERYGLLINYEYCDGCHACEVACMKHHKFADPTASGLVVKQYGPNKKEDGRWELNWVPAITESCDFCAERVGTGRKPSCVQHCQSSIIKFGKVADLAAEMDAPKMVLYTSAAR